MFYKLSILFILFLLFVGRDAKKNWEYEPISFDTRTADPNKMDLQVRIKRMPRGEFSYDGYMNFIYDVNENTMVEAIAYRSQSGREDDYTLMPWTIEKQSFTSYVENFYESMIYSNFAECTNFPKPEEANPWKSDNYTFKECVVEGKGMPEMAPQGYYKVVFSATGDVEWGFEAVVRIFDSVMP